MDVAVLIPVKDFRQAKARLAGVATPEARAALARWMAERVMAAAEPAPLFVVCDDEAVAAWAQGCGATVLWQPGVGLNAAATDGVAAVAAAGFDHVVVAHSDLPLAHELPSLAVDGMVTLVPDRHGDGTNVLALPTDRGFHFHYGARSFRRHLAEATRLGLPTRVVHDERLALDVDTHEDLSHPLTLEVLPPWLTLTVPPPTSPVSPR